MRPPVMRQDQWPPQSCEHEPPKLAMLLEHPWIALPLASSCGP